MGVQWGEVSLPGLIAALAFQALVGGLLLTPFLCCAGAVWRRGHPGLARQWFRKKAFGCFLRGFCIGAGISVIGVLTAFQKSLYGGTHVPAIISHILILPGRVVAEFIYGVEYMGSWRIQIIMLLQGILGGMMYPAISLTRWLNAQSLVREEQGRAAIVQEERKPSQLRAWTIVLLCIITIVVALGPPVEMLFVAPLLCAIAVVAILLFWKKTPDD